MQCVAMLWMKRRMHWPKVSAVAGHDPGFLNLMGIVHECRGRKRQARKCYGRAIAINSCYAPAQRNLRRLYELKIFGSTRELPVLGDELERGQHREQASSLSLIMIAPQQTNLVSAQRVESRSGTFTAESSNGRRDSSAE
jgi:hypothetical protein